MPGAVAVGQLEISAVLDAFAASYFVWKPHAFNQKRILVTASDRVHWLQTLGLSCSSSADFHLDTMDLAADRATDFGLLVTDTSTLPCMQGGYGLADADRVHILHLVIDIHACVQELKAELYRVKTGPEEAQAGHREAEESRTMFCLLESLVLLKGISR